MDIKEFNKSYFEFLEYIKKYNKSSKYAMFYQKNYLLKKTNPKLIITLWNRRISPYHESIINGDVSFFMNGSFEEIDSAEVQNNIHYFKELYQLMPDEHKPGFVKHVQIITNNCYRYFNKL